MIRANRIILVFVFLIAYGCGHKDNQNCSEFYKQYSTLISDQRNKLDTVQLINTLSAIISRDTFCINAYLARGDLFFSSGDSKKARADYQRVLLKDSKNVYALYKMGLLYQEGELYDSSVHFLQTAISAKTHGDWVVNFNQINKDLATKEAEYDVTAAALFYTQAVSLYYRRDLQRALNDFNFCIRSNYKLEKAYFFRGAIYEECNKKDSACEDFRKAKLYGNVEAEEYLKKYCN